jgi:hypothetical protein
MTAVVEIFGPKYMREHNEQDTPRLLEIGASIGFPGSLGSVNCMQWPWKNCPTAHHGMYMGHKKEPTVLKVVYRYGMHSLEFLVHTMT